MNNVRLVNFRNIKDSGEIELKPLTVFVGKNGSGKSSLLRLFPLLQQSMSVPRQGPLLWYHEKGVDFGDFETTVRKGEQEIKIGFAINCNRNDEDFPVKILMTIVPDENDKGYDCIREMTLEFLGNKVIFEYKDDGSASVVINKTKKIDVKYSVSLYGLFPYISFEQEYKVLGFQELRDCLSKDGKYIQYTEPSDFIGLSFEKFQQLLEDKEFNYNIKETYNSIVFAYLSDLVFNLSMTLNFEMLSLTYIGPFRTAPSRYSRMQNLTTKQINKDGSNMAVFVNAMKDMNQFNDLLQTKFNFELHSKSHFGQISLFIDKDGREANIIDTGFGYSQVMPILLALYTFDRTNIKSEYPFGRGDNTLCIEQPELHLHPSMQYKLGELFFDSVKKIVEAESPKKIILETHSRSIIEAIGNSLVTTNSVKPSDIAVYIFDTVEGNAEIKCSSFNEDGYLTNWPLGFLD